MEEINLSELFKYVKSKWLLIVIIVLVFGLLGTIYYAFIQVPKYTSSTTVILVSGNSESSISQTDITINSKLVATYKEIIRSRNVINQVIEELGLEADWADLRNDITVSAVSDTEIIQINVTNEDAVLAYRVANSLATVFSSTVADIYNLSNISILDRAVISNTPSSIGAPRIFAMAILGGLVVAAGIVFVLFYFDTTIKSVDQIEAKLDVPVLGSIPVYSTDKKKSKGEKNE